MVHDLTGMGRAFVFVSPHLARWVTPEIHSTSIAGFFGLAEIEIEFSWGADNKLVLLDSGILIECEIGMGDDGHRILWREFDDWDGTLPPEFVEFMDEHFRKEGGNDNV